MTIRICGECKKQMGQVEDGRAEISPTPGVCQSCMRTNHSAAYLWLREREAMRRGAPSGRIITMLLEGTPRFRVAT